MDEMEGNIGGPATVASAFPEIKRGLKDTLKDKKMSDPEAEAALMGRIQERHAEVLSGKKEVVKFFDVREEIEASVEMHVEDIQKVQRYVDELKGCNKLQPLPVTSEITLADLANIGILLGWEVGLFLKDRQLYLATNQEIKGIEAPPGGYKFVAHSHPTLSDEAGQITSDKRAAGMQLEIAVNAKYTVMIYSNGKCYNVTHTAHTPYEVLNSRLDSTQTRMENHRIYFRQPLQINALEKLGTDANDMEELLPQSSTGSPDDSAFFDFLFGADFLNTDDLGDQESSKNNAPSHTKVGGKKEKQEPSSGKSTPSSPKKRSSNEFFGGYVPGSVPGSETSQTQISKEAAATHAVHDFFANCTEREANEFMEKISSLKTKVFGTSTNRSPTLEKK